MVIGGTKEDYDDQALHESLDQINRYLRKELIIRHRTLKKIKNQTPDKMNPLINLLLQFDKYADQVDIFRRCSDELFPVVFKMTLFNDKKYSIANMPLDDLKPWDHDELLERMEKEELLASKLNLVVNNLIMKHVYAMENSEKPVQKKLIMSVSEELFGDDKVKTNKRTARLMLIMGLLF